MNSVQLEMEAKTESFQGAGESETQCRLRPSKPLLRTPMDKTKRFNVWAHKTPQYPQFILQNSGLHNVRKVVRTSSPLDPTSLGLPLLDGVETVDKNAAVIAFWHFIF